MAEKREALAIREFDHWVSFILITVDLGTKQGITVFEQHPRANVIEPSASGGAWDIVEEKNRYIPQSRRPYREADDAVSLFPPVFSDKLTARLRKVRDKAEVVAA